MFPEANVVVTEHDIGFSFLVFGECNVVSGESSDVLETNARAAGYRGDYEVSVGTFSMEHLAWVTREDDPFFSDIVSWVSMSLISAEEQGITMATADDLGTTDVFVTDLQFMFIVAILRRDL